MKNLIFVYLERIRTLLSLKMKIYSFLSFLISTFALNVNKDSHEKQVALYPLSAPLRPIPVPILKPKPIILHELDEEAYYLNNVYDELEEIEKIEV